MAERLTPNDGRRAAQEAARIVSAEQNHGLIEKYGSYLRLYYYSPIVADIMRGAVVGPISPVNQLDALAILYRDLSMKHISLDKARETVIKNMKGSQNK